MVNYIDYNYYKNPFLATPHNVEIAVIAPSYAIF